MNSYLISLDGNIGSGKSTLGNIIKNIGFINNKKVIFLSEPVDIWKSIKNSENKDILECFYNDIKKYSFSFQMMAYISRLSQIKNTIKNNPNSIIISERSVFSDKNIFAKMLYDDNQMEEIEYTIYKKWFDELTEDIIKLNGIIYLKTEPKVSFNRIKKRNRNGENNIPLSYIEKCHSYHESWVKNKSNILILDGNIEINEKDSIDYININESNIRNKLFLHKITNYIKSLITY